MTTHSIPVFAGMVVLCLIAFEPQVSADDAPKELEIHSTNPFATDPFEPALNWRLSEDAESLVLERFGSPVHKSVAAVWSRFPDIELEETTLLYPDVQFVLVGRVGLEFKRISRIRVFGPALSLRHGIRIGMAPSEFAEALGLPWDRSIRAYPIRIAAEHQEVDVANDGFAKIHSEFRAHEVLGTIQFMSWDFLRD